MKFIKMLMLVAAVLMPANFAFTQTWTPTSSPSERWQTVASSADGNKLVGILASVIWVSTNSGATWAKADAPRKIWYGVASSADGSKFAGTAQANPVRGFSGGIYAAQTIPRPQLGLVPIDGDFLLSWIVPAATFGLQQN